MVGALTDFVACQLVKHCPARRHETESRGTIRLKGMKKRSGRYETVHEHHCPAREHVAAHPSKTTGVTKRQRHHFHIVRAVTDELIDVLRSRLDTSVCQGYSL